MTEKITTQKEESIALLEGKARDLLNASKSAATKRAYTSDWKTFTRWAIEQERAFLPASGATVVLYLTYLSEELGRAPSTISRAITAINQAHKAMGFDAPGKQMVVVELFKGIKRTKGTAQKQAKPILLADLKKIVRACGPSFLGRRDAALILVGWAGALRRSELVALNVEDVDFVSEGMTIKIKRSKTDQEGESFLIGVPYGKKEDMCPVLALLKWIGLCQITTGPIFFAVGTPGKEKFYTNVDDKRHLSGRSVNIIIKRRLKNAGISQRDYSGHSLRAGFITSAASKGIPEHVIQVHTRHRSTKVLRGYIRQGNIFEENPLSILV